MDETSIIADKGTNGLVLLNSGRNTAQALTSIVEAISVTDKVLSPLVILRGSTGQQPWVPDDMKSLIYGGLHHQSKD